MVVAATGPVGQPSPHRGAEFGVGRAAICAYHGRVVKSADRESNCRQAEFESVETMAQADPTSAPDVYRAAIVLASASSGKATKKSMASKGFRK